MNEPPQQPGQNKRPHNKQGIWSLIIFLVTFGLWLGALALFGNELVKDSKLGGTNYFFVLDLVTLVPYLWGFIIGIKGSLNKDTNPALPFAGLALNGIMVFRIVFAVMGLDI